MADASPIAVQATPLRDVAANARLVAGVYVSASTGKVSSALIAAADSVANPQVDVLAHATGQASGDVVRMLHQTTSGEATVEAPVTLAAVGPRLASAQASVVQQMLKTAGVPFDRVLALVAHDPGEWHYVGEKVTGYAGLTSPAHLAQWTGLNVIDALPARDIAMAGQGGPIAALAEARLLQTRHRSSLLIDLGRTLRATYVPAESLTRGRSDKRPRVLSFDVGPGMALVDALAQKLTGGGQSLDAGGRLAVQGQQLPELMAHWQRDPYFDGPLPRWRPEGVSPERFLSDSYRLAVQSNWSVRDLLCTATHFVAQQVADTALRRLPAGYPVDEVILTGGGLQNGLLMRQLTARLPKIPLVRISERCCPAEAFSPAAVAAAGLLTIEGQPATLPEISGVVAPCIAGRLTPGLPLTWRRLLDVMLSPPVSGLTLRSA